MVYERQKIQHFTCFCITMLFQRAQRYKTNATHYFIMKISNKREVKQIGSNHSADTQFKDFTKRYKEYAETPF